MDLCNSDRATVGELRVNCWNGQFLDLVIHSKLYSPTLIVETIRESLRECKNGENPELGILMLLYQ